MSVAAAEPQQGVTQPEQPKRPSEVTDIETDGESLPKTPETTIAMSELTAKKEEAVERYKQFEAGDAKLTDDERIAHKKLEVRAEQLFEQGQDIQHERLAKHSNTLHGLNGPEKVRTLVHIATSKQGPLYALKLARGLGESDASVVDAFHDFSCKPENSHLLDKIFG